MKKIASLFIALIMLLSLSVTAFANEREVVIGTVHTNEYDYSQRVCCVCMVNRIKIKQKMPAALPLAFFLVC